MTGEPNFKRLAIIGAGLIGSSIARAARKASAAQHVTLCDHDQVTADQAAALDIVEHVTTELKEAVTEADAVILCVPVGAIAALSGTLAAHVKPGAIVSDVGSVKASVAAAFKALPASVHAIPAHPVAGTEKSGPEAGFDSLFQQRWCIITPPEDADATAVAQLTQFWRALGSTVEIMTPDHHDRVLAITSHVPHLIAYNIVGTASDLEEVTRSEVIKFSAGGFRDFTRIA
ncbi:MAG: prephenate dehydrogenase/arogenate dehydrogenase family protein, partial [Pseudomonadota bacterium]